MGTASSEHFLPQLPLFAFGTLRRGHSNHHLLTGRFTQVSRAVLPGFGRVQALMIAPNPQQQVAGELFHIKPERYRQTMKQIDQLEGIPAGQLTGALYRRIRVQVSTDLGRQEAWAYVRPDTPEDFCSRD